MATRPFILLIGKICSVIQYFSITVIANTLKYHIFYPIKHLKTTNLYKLKEILTFIISFRALETRFL